MFHFFLIVPVWNIVIEVDYDEIIDIYWNTEKKCRKYSKRACLYIYFNQAAFVAAIIFSVAMILSGRFDSSKLRLPFNLAVPFDIKSVYGWHALWFIQFRWIVSNILTLGLNLLTIHNLSIYFEFSIGLSYALSVVPIISYFVCCCLYIDTIREHFIKIIGLLERDVIKWQRAKNQLIYQNIHQQIKWKLYNAIDIHGKIFE